MLTGWPCTQKQPRAPARGHQHRIAPHKDKTLNFSFALSWKSSAIPPGVSIVCALRWSLRAAIWTRVLPGWLCAPDPELSVETGVEPRDPSQNYFGMCFHFYLNFEKHGHSPKSIFLVCWGRRRSFMALGRKTSHLKCHSDPGMSSGPPPR